MFTSDSTLIHTALLANPNADSLDIAPAKIKNMVGEFVDIFATPRKPTSPYVQHKIYLFNNNEYPPHHRQYKMSLAE